MSGLEVFNILILVFLVAAALTAGIAATQQSTPASTMSAAAHVFLDTLSTEKRDAVMFPFYSEDRFDWHFIPRERKGLPFKLMTETQQNAALGLLRASLSEDGYDKSQMIRELELILFEREGRADRDRDLYFFMIFGLPHMILSNSCHIKMVRKITVHPLLN